MKKTVILIFAVLSYSIVSAQSSWSLIQLGFPEELNAVAAATGSAICIGGEFGDIRRGDTNLNFTSTLPGNNEGIADVLFTAWGEGWAVAEDGLIFRSSDSGQSWVQGLSGVTNNLESICFVNQDTAYIAGRDGVILRSTDGGTSWTQLTSGTTERLEAISFASSTHGFIAGRNGIFLETQDAGNTWTNVSLGPDDNKDVLFISSGTGFVAGGNGLMRTTNGGVTWNTVLSSNIVELENLDIHNSSGVAVGEDGNIYSSKDSGLTWTMDTMFAAMLSLEFNDVSFIDSIGIVAVGEGGYIAHRFNAGGSVSVTQIETAQIRTFPNPVQNQLYLEIPAGLQISNVLLVNGQGRQVMEKNFETRTLDLSNIPDGYYILLFADEKGLLSYTNKIMVTH